MELLCSSNVFGSSSQYTCHRVMNGAPVPDTTDLHCYHDCHPFDGKPVVDEHVYCSWACRKAHLKETPSAHNTLMLQELATKARAQSGVCGEIHPAPARACLAIFGGPLSIAQFRAMSDSGGTSAFVVPEILMTQRVMYEVRNLETDAQSFKKMFDAHEQSAAPEARTQEGLYHELDGMNRAKGNTLQSKLGSFMTKRKQV